MKKASLIIFFAFSCTILNAQTAIKYTNLDVEILSEIFKNAKNNNPAEIGKLLLGTPYVAHTLENDKEILTINLRELDCTTFVENVVVISTLIAEKKTGFTPYIQRLKNFRYRNGKINGYASRIHYFSDWIAENQKRGFLKDITKELGGKPYKKEINFMTKNREKYPQMKDRKTFEKIKKTEQTLNKMRLFYIPKENVENIESIIENGDIIAITGSIKNLDIVHVGIAVKNHENNRTYFMHAMYNNKVVITDAPLCDYLMNKKNGSGIMVVRVNNLEK